MNVIEPIDASKGVSPLVARTKDGNIRLCVNLRAPNKKVVADCFELPAIEDILNAIDGAK